MRKAKSIIVVTILSFFILATSALSAEFWASAKSNKYHYPSCRWAQKIKSSNLIVFKNPEEAIQAGYVPCKVCRPPIKQTQQESGTP